MCNVVVVEKADEGVISQGTRKGRTTSGYNRELHNQSRLSTTSLLCKGNEELVIREMRDFTLLNSTQT